jgi:hypothetical protein
MGGAALSRRGGLGPYPSSVRADDGYRKKRSTHPTGVTQALAGLLRHKWLELPVDKRVSNLKTKKPQTLICGFLIFC